MLDLPVGELVRAGLPVRGDAEPGLVGLGQAVRAACTRVRCAGRPSARVEHACPVSKVRTVSWRRRTPAGSSASIARRDAGAVDDVLERGQRDAHRLSALAAEQRDRVLLAAGVQGGDDVAEPLAAGDPGGVHERGQADQLRAVGQPGGAQPAGVQPGQPGPAGQRPGQRAGDVVPARVGAAGDQLIAGERR